MRTLVIATSLTLAFSALAAQAAPTGREDQPATAPPLPPKVFLEAGYSQPDITPGLCKNLNADQTQCVIPAMTAGNYYAEAVGTSTASGDGAAQQLIIVAGDQSCQATRAATAKAPWTVGEKKSLRAGCVFTVVTDTPLAVTAVYRDAKATKDAAGPQLSLRRAPWAGALLAIPVQQKQQ
jgi:hypothetical protein